MSDSDKQHLVLFMPSGKRGHFQSGTPVIEAARSHHIVHLALDGSPVDSLDQLIGFFESMGVSADGTL